MKILGIIPARYDSSRFPGKPLANIHGKSMIMHVYDQSKKCALLADVVVATDDERIQNHVLKHGGKAIMTAKTHNSGTDRCKEVLEKYSTTEPFQAVINIQGDEPYINPKQIEQVAALLINNKEVQIATLIKKIASINEPFNPNVVKVVTDSSGRALYFSRSEIPFIRNKKQPNSAQGIDRYRHIGIYGYRSDILRQISTLPAAPLEEAEKLEQLRWLWNGYVIHTAQTEYESYGIDTPEDLSKLINIG